MKGSMTAHQTAQLNNETLHRNWAKTNKFEQDKIQALLYNIEKQWK